MPRPGVNPTESCPFEFQQDRGSGNRYLFSSEAFYVLRSDRFLLLLLGASQCVNGEKAGHQVLFPASEAVDSGQTE